MASRGFHISAAVCLVGLICGHAEAASSHEQCSGILHKKGHELWFGGARGEGESICMIAPAQVDKVLRVCAAGSYCQVSGTAADCEGTGECTEIKRVFTVTRKRPRPR